MQTIYNDKVVPAILNHDGGLGNCWDAGRGGHSGPAHVASAEFRFTLVSFWSVAAIAYERRDFRLWWLSTHGYFIVYCSKNLPNSTGVGRARGFCLLGWQLVIVLAAVTLPLGFTSSKEYAELEWPIDILITIVWVAYAILFFATVAKRKTQHIYVANWFFAAFIVAVAILHIFNSLAVPVSLTKSYSIYAGAVDAMVQWWYGHNAVGFFLTAGFLGMMYYFVPKQAGRPGV